MGLLHMSHVHCCAVGWGGVRVLIVPVLLDPVGVVGGFANAGGVLLVVGGDLSAVSECLELLRW